MRKLIAVLLLLGCACLCGRAQIYSLGADPARVKWKVLESERFRIVYPEAADSLALEYAKSLESFADAQKYSSGFSANEMYRRKMRPTMTCRYSAAGI